MSEDEGFETEVLREMTTPLLEVPEFRGHIKEEDVADLDRRDRKMLVAMSVIEQKTDFLIRAVRLNNRHQRLMEAESIRARNVQKEINWKFAAFKWIAVTAGAGIVAALISKVFR